MTMAARRSTPRPAQLGVVYSPILGFEGTVPYASTTSEFGARFSAFGTEVLVGTGTLALIGAGLQFAISKSTES